MEQDSNSATPVFSQDVGRRFVWWSLGMFLQMLCDSHFASFHFEKFTTSRQSLFESIPFDKQLTHIQADGNSYVKQANV